MLKSIFSRGYSALDNIIERTVTARKNIELSTTAYV